MPVKIGSGESNIAFANDPKLVEIPKIPAPKAKTSNQAAVSTSSNVNTTYAVPPGKENVYFPQLSNGGNECPVLTEQDVNQVLNNEGEFMRDFDAVEDFLMHSSDSF